MAKKKKTSRRGHRPRIHAETLSTNTTIPLTAAQLAHLRAHVEALGEPLSAWGRRVLLEAAGWAPGSDVAP